MSGAEFPLTLLLQVQDDMSAGVSSAASSMDELDTAAQKAEGSTSTLQNRVSTGGGDFLKFGLGVAAAAGSIINLIRQYHNLQRAQAMVENMQRREENTTLTLTNAKENLQKAIKKHGKNSKEAEKAERAVTKAENAHETATSRLEQSQISLNDRMTDFAFSIIPSVVGVVAGLAQTFQVLGGGRGIAGLGTGFLKLGGILLAAGVVLFAIKTNLFGVRDAIQQFGFQLGQAVPALQPFLNFIQDVGVALGLLPGDATKAKLGIKGFSDNVKKWAGEAWQMVQDTVQKFMKDPIQTVIDIAVGVGKMITDIKVGGFSLGQWIAGLPIVISGLIAKEGPVLATIDIITNIGNMLLPPDSQIKSQFDAWMARLKAKFIGFSVNPGTGFRGIFEAIWDNLINGPEALRPFKGKDVFAQPFADMQANWDMRVKQFQAFVVANPILSGIVNFLGTLPDLNLQFNNWVSTQIGLIKVTFKQLVIAIQNLFITLPAQIESAMTAIGTGALQGARIINLTLAGIFGTASEIASNASSWFVTNVITPISNAWDTLMSNVGKLFLIGARIINIGTQWVTDVLGGIFGTISEIASTASSWFVTNVITPIKTAWDELWNNIGSLLGLGNDTAGGGGGQGLSIQDLINKLFNKTSFTIPSLTLTPQAVVLNMDDIIGGSIGCGALGGGFSGGGGCQLPMSTLTLAPSAIQVSTANSGPVTLQNVAQTDGNTDTGNNLDAKTASQNAFNIALLQFDSIITDLITKFPQFNAGLLLFSTTIPLINASMILFNAQSLLLNTSLILMNVQFLLLNASMLLFNASMLLLNTQILLLNTQFLLLNASLLLFNASLIILNAQLLLLNTNMILLNATILLFNTMMPLVIANLTLWIVANNLLAVTINQVTINVLALIAAGNTLAVVINQITINTNAWIKANNTLAQTINQLTINTNALSNAVIALTKATAAMTKATAAMTKATTAASSAMKSAASAAKSLASAYNTAAAAANKLAAAQSKIGKAGGGTMATGGLLSAATGKMFTTKGETMVRVGDNPGGKETVAFIPHNNPGPTLDKLSRMFAGTQLQGNNAGGRNGRHGSSQPMIVQVFMDGEEMKVKMVRTLPKNQLAFK